MKSVDTLEVIRDMIVEYSDMEYDNNVRYPTDEEKGLTVKGRYGKMALEDLLQRLEQEKS